MAYWFINQIQNPLWIYSQTNFKVARGTPKQINLLVNECNSDLLSVQLHYEVSFHLLILLRRQILPLEGAFYLQWNTHDKQPGCSNITWNIYGIQDWTDSPFYAFLSFKSIIIITHQMTRKIKDSSHLGPSGLSKTIHLSFSQRVQIRKKYLNVFWNLFWLSSHLRPKRRHTM